MAGKTELRESCSRLRRTLKSEQKDKMIAEQVLKEDHVVAADTVLLFASFGSEPDTWALAQELLDVGKRVAFPRSGDNGVMTFHIVRDIARLHRNIGKYGICEPEKDFPEPELTDNTVCIVPGLAFTEKGERLGYGGGYYDRFFAQYSSVYRVALTYEGCLVSEVPCNEHDLCVDKIITEERTVVCNAEKRRSDKQYIE